MANHVVTPANRALSSSILGNTREGLVGITLDAAGTYATGGIPVAPAQFGLSQVYAVDPIVFSTGHWGIYDITNSKVKVFSAAGTELANASAALQNATTFIHAYGV